MPCPYWTITVIIKLIFTIPQPHLPCVDIHHHRHWSVLFPSKRLDGWKGQQEGVTFDVLPVTEAYWKEVNHYGQSDVTHDVRWSLVIVAIGMGNVTFQTVCVCVCMLAYRVCVMHQCSIALEVVGLLRTWVCKSASPLSRLPQCLFMASHGHMSLQTLNQIAGVQVQLSEPALSYWDNVHRTQTYWVPQYWQAIWAGQMYGERRWLETLMGSSCENDIEKHVKCQCFGQKWQNIPIRTYGIWGAIYTNPIIERNHSFSKTHLKSLHKALLTDKKEKMGG